MGPLHSPRKAASCRGKQAAAAAVHDDSNRGLCQLHHRHRGCLACSVCLEQKKKVRLPLVPLMQVIPHTMLMITDSTVSIVLLGSCRVPCPLNVP
jgi:hypothetical protein